MLLPLNYKTLQSRMADEVRHRAAKAVWLRYAPQRPPPPNYPSGFAAMSRSPMPSVSPAPVGRSAMDSEPVANTIRSPLSFDLVKPSGAPLSDNGK